MRYPNLAAKRNWARDFACSIHCKGNHDLATMGRVGVMLKSESKSGVSFSSSSSSSQQWNAAGYAANAHFVPALGQPVLDLLQPQSGERILDLGCGDGALTEKLAALGARVVGIDTSEEMIAAARKRSLDARVVDAKALPFENEFDAVFSMPCCTGSRTIRTRRWLVHS